MNGKTRQLGVTLVELIISIVILAVAATGSPLMSFGSGMLASGTPSLVQSISHR